MNTNRLNQILDEISYMVEKDTQIEGLEVVDLDLVCVGVNKELAEKAKPEFVEILKKWPKIAWGNEIPSLAEGPSYIHIGGVLGDQGKALKFIAVGKVLGLWMIICPNVIGITGEDAQSLAGSGLVMIVNYKEQ